MVRIRPMAESDAGHVAGILVDCYRLLAGTEGFTEDQLHRLLTERSTESVVREGWLKQWDCHVMESDEGVVVGALAIDGDDVGELFVTPEHHRQGFGATLFRYAEARVRQAGHRKLTLRCAARSAAPFYEAMEMCAVDTRACPFGPLEGWPLTYYEKRL